MRASEAACITAAPNASYTASSPPTQRRAAPVVWQPVLLAWGPGHEEVAAAGDRHVVPVGAARNVAEAALVVGGAADACGGKQHGAAVNISVVRQGQCSAMAECRAAVQTASCKYRAACSCKI
jgi:hypothetical protein